QPPPLHDELAAVLHLLCCPQRRAAVHPARLRGSGGAPGPRAGAVLRDALPRTQPAGVAMNTPAGKLLVAFACCVAVIVAAPAGAANSHAQISGSGSSWA